jgi:hypothetical protein
LIASHNDLTGGIVSAQGHPPFRDPIARIPKKLLRMSQKSLTGPIQILLPVLDAPEQLS